MSGTFCSVKRNRLKEPSCGKTFAILSRSHVSRAVLSCAQKHLGTHVVLCVLREKVVRGLCAELHGCWDSFGDHPITLKRF